MDGFDDDFSPLQGSGVRNTSSIDPPLCPTGNISISPSILDENNADLKEGDDVPALRCKIDKQYCVYKWNFDVIYPKLGIPKCAFHISSISKSTR